MCLVASPPDKHSRVRQYHALYYERKTARVVGARPHVAFSTVKVRGEENAVQTGVLHGQTTDIVTAEVVVVRQAMRDAIQKTFTNGPNSRHFVSTVLFSCLLPSVGFHVLSRTGHTGFIDAFRIKNKSILHSSNHLKYQYLSLFMHYFAVSFRKW